MTIYRILDEVGLQMLRDRLSGTTIFRDKSSGMRRVITGHVEMVICRMTE